MSIECMRLPQGHEIATLFRFLAKFPKFSKISNQNFQKFQKFYCIFFENFEIVPKSFMGGCPFWHEPCGWDMANCLRAIEKGRTCMCKCRHGLRMLVRAKIGVQPQCPGMQVFGTMTLQHAMRMAQCKCCTDHQNKRPDIDSIQELF